MGLLDWVFAKNRVADQTWTLVHHTDVNAGGVRYQWQGSDGNNAALADTVARESAHGVDRLLLADLDLLEDEGLVVDGLLPFTVISKLESDGDFQRLRLEISRGWRAEARPSRKVGDRRPEVEVHWHAPDETYFVGVDDERFRPVPCGFWDQSKRALHILPPPLIEIRELVAGQPDRFARVSQEYAFLQRVQELAEDGTEFSELGVVALDDQLRGERYIVPKPEEVEVDVRRTETGGLSLRPVMPGHESFESADELLENPIGETAFRPVGPGGLGRERITYDEEVRQRIEVVKAVAEIPPEEVADFERDPGRYIADRASATREDLRGVAESMDFGLTTRRVIELDLSTYGSRVTGESDYVPGPSYEPRSFESPHGRGLLGEPDEDEQKAPVHEERDDPTPEKVPGKVLAVVENLDEVQFAAKTSASLRDRLLEYPPPGSFRGTLRPHQLEGHVWLRNLWEAAVQEPLGQGGVLADEMGLGKTVQVASLTAFLRDHNLLRPSAIVAPSTVIENWPGELAKFVGPDVRVLRHQGPGRTRDPEAIAAHDLVLVSYDTLVRDQREFAKIPFQALVLDEAHFIKNQGVKRSRASRALQAKLRLALTATPVENRLEELWAIVEFAQPGLLGSLREFSRNVVTPLESGGEQAHQAQTQLLSTLGPHYLRRTKSQVLELPPKTVTPVNLEMSPVQLEVYEAVRRHHRATSRGALAAIHDLVRVSAHPAAVAELAPKLGLEDLMRDITSSTERFLDASVKFRFLFDRLQEICDRGEKAVIFTSVRAVQPLVQMAVNDVFGFRPLALNGDQSAKTRFQEIERFNERPGFDVIVLSAQATGLGVNITAANHVFHLTREWNPSKENQATDRVHRIGQTRPVQVWVPVVGSGALFSVDQRIQELMEVKGALATAVIRPSADLSFSTQDLAVCLEDLAPEAARQESERLQKQRVVERATMASLLREPVAAKVKTVENPVPVQSPAPAAQAPATLAPATVAPATSIPASVQKPRVKSGSDNHQLARAIFALPTLGSRLEQRGLGADRDVLLLECLLERKRMHLKELSRTADIRPNRLRSRLAAMKAALNASDTPLLSSSNDYYHLNLDTLNSEYGLSYEVLSSRSAAG